MDSFEFVIYFLLINRDGDFKTKKVVEYDNIDENDSDEAIAKREKKQRQEEEEFSGSEDEYQEVKTQLIHLVDVAQTKGY